MKTLVLGLAAIGAVNVLVIFAMVLLFIRYLVLENRRQKDFEAYQKLMRRDRSFDEFKYVCGYCDSYIRGPIDGRESHGICPDCLLKYEQLHNLTPEDLSK